MRAAWVTEAVSVRRRHQEAMIELLRNMSAIAGCKRESANVGSLRDSIDEVVDVSQVDPRYAEY